MNKVIHHPARQPKHNIQSIVVIILAASLSLILAGCGGSSKVKVFDSQKSLTYNGSLYNVSNVKVMSSSIEARPAGGRAVLDLTNSSRKQFDAYVADYGALPVEMVITIDEQKLLYYSATISRFSDFDRARKRFSKAKKSVANFMADRKKTQLNLE